MNEGWATFWHYSILNHMYDKGLLTDGFMLEILQSHTNVVYQPPYNHPYYGGINPYALGFNMMRDIKRICTNPTEEDKYWFPDFAGSPWLDTLHFAMANFKDESFINQFLSPHMMREFRLFALNDDDAESHIEVAAIHNEQGFRDVRNTLASQYNLSNLEPNIQVHHVDVRGDRSLVLRYVPHNRIPLGKGIDEVMKHLYRLWGFTVKLEEEDSSGNINTLAVCPETNNQT